MSDYSAAWCEENPGAASLTIERLRAMKVVELEEQRNATIEECARVVEAQWYAVSNCSLEDIVEAIRALRDKSL